MTNATETGYIKRDLPKPLMIKCGRTYYRVVSWVVYTEHDNSLGLNCLQGKNGTTEKFLIPSADAGKWQFFGLTGTRYTLDCIDWDLSLLEQSDEAIAQFLKTYSPTLEKKTVAKRPPSDAQLCKAKLKAAFPGVKFSCSSRHYSSIDISWIDGPTVAEVEAISDEYENVRRCEITHEILSGGNTFVFCKRNYSETTYRPVMERVAKQWLNTEDRGVPFITQEEFDLLETKENWDGKGVEMNQTIIAPNRQCMSQAIAQELKDVSFCNRPKVASAPTEAAQKVEATEPNQITVTLKHNEEKNGIEIHFSSKPDRKTLKALGASVFRYHSKNEFWYAKRNDSTLSFAQDIARQFSHSDTEATQAPATETETGNDTFKIAIDGNEIEITHATEFTPAQETELLDAGMDKHLSAGAFYGPLDQFQEFLQEFKARWETPLDQPETLMLPAAPELEPPELEPEETLDQETTPTIELDHTIEIIATTETPDPLEQKPAIPQRDIKFLDRVLSQYIPQIPALSR